MSDSNASDPESHSAGLSTERKRKRSSSEVTASFGSFSEFGESNIGSTVNGDQERSFSFGTDNNILSEVPSLRSPAPKPTSCCQSLSPRPSSQVKASTNTNVSDTSSTIPASSSDPPPSPNRKFLLVSKPKTTMESESHLPGKKRTFVPAPQSDSPSMKLTLGSKIFRPFDQVNTLSHGSLFSGSSSKASTFLSWPTQSSQLGKLVIPMETTSYEEEVVQSGTETVSDEDGVLTSLSSKPAFLGISQEELRWQNYQHGFRGNNFGTSSAWASTSTTSNGFNQIPPLAFGQTNSQPSSLFNQSNMINITVPSFHFGQQNFTGHPFLLCLNNGPGFGFGQTFPCIIAFPQSASAFPEQNTSPAGSRSPPAPNDFGSFGGSGGT